MACPFHLELGGTIANRQRSPIEMIGRNEHSCLYLVPCAGGSGVFSPDFGLKPVLLLAALARECADLRVAHLLAGPDINRLPFSFQYHDGEIICHQVAAPAAKGDRVTFSKGFHLHSERFAVLIVANDVHTLCVACCGHYVETNAAEFSADPIQADISNNLRLHFGSVRYVFPERPFMTPNVMLCGGVSTVMKHGTTLPAGPFHLKLGGGGDKGLACLSSNREALENKRLPAIGRTAIDSPANGRL